MTTWADQVRKKKARLDALGLAAKEESAFTSARRVLTFALIVLCLILVLLWPSTRFAAGCALALCAQHLALHIWQTRVWAPTRMKEIEREFPEET